MSAPLRNSFARWSTRSCHLSKVMLQKPHRDLIYWVSDFHMSMLAVILQPCLVSVSSSLGTSCWFYSHQPQVLSKMVFSIERARFEAFLFASAVVVRIQVLLTGLEFVTIDTFALSGSLVNDDLA
jgi:hypothetical protein